MKIRLITIFSLKRALLTWLFGGILLLSPNCSDDDDDAGSVPVEEEDVEGKLDSAASASKESSAEDDLDEEELYLRLTALRSMAPELADEEPEQEIKLDLSDDDDEGESAAENNLPYLVQKLRKSLHRVRGGDPDETEYDPSAPCSPLSSISMVDLDLDLPHPDDDDDDDDEEHMDQGLELLSPSPSPPLRVNLAEQKFFKDQEQQQEDIFPQSVWAFKTVNDQVAADEQIVNTKAKRRRAKKRPRLKANQSRQVVQVPLVDLQEANKKAAEAPGDEDEDADQMRMALLTDLLKKRREKEEKERKESQSKPTLAITVSENKRRKVEKVKELNECQRNLHFPNLVKSVIIPIDPHQQESSDDEEEGAEPKSAFEVSLQSLLDEGRKNAKVKKRTPPPKPARKHLPPHNNRNNLLSVKAKKSLMNSSVQHLPPEKQAEYKILKEKLAKLLSQKKTAAVQPTKPKSTKSTQLIDNEKDLLRKRADLVKNLFKLSAEMSSLKDATAKKKAAEAFVADLKRQLVEAEAALNKKSERISSLKHIVLKSHKEVAEHRTGVKSAEEKCKSLAEKGEKYALPSAMSALIRSKLSSIAVTSRQLSSSKPKSPKKKSVLSGALAHLRSPKLPNSVILDPHKELCRFELQGVCNDDKCQFQHTVMTHRTGSMT